LKSPASRGDHQPDQERIWSLASFHGAGVEFLPENRRNIRSQSLIMFHPLMNITGFADFQQVTEFSIFAKIGAGAGVKIF